VEGTGISRASAASRQEHLPRVTGRTEASAGALAKMKELKQLREQDLISADEYEKKRARILKDL
jgi:hypothetical protein